MCPNYTVQGGEATVTLRGVVRLELEGASRSRLPCLPEFSATSNYVLSVRWVSTSVGRDLYPHRGFYLSIYAHVSGTVSYAACFVNEHAADALRIVDYL